MNEKVKTYLSASPIMNVEWAVSTEDEKQDYIDRILKILTDDELEILSKEEVNNELYDKIINSFKSMWTIGKWHKTYLLPDDLEAIVMKQQLNEEVEKMIIDDMKQFKKKNKSFEEWATDSVWSKDTGGPKDPSTGAPIRALGGRWKELWQLDGGFNRNLLSIYKYPILIGGSDASIKAAEARLHIAKFLQERLYQSMAVIHLY